VRDAQNKLAEQSAFFIGNTVGGRSFETAEDIQNLPVIIRLTEAYNEESKRWNDLIRERLRLKKEGEVALGGEAVLDQDATGENAAIGGALGQKERQPVFEVGEEIERQKQKWLEWKENAVSAITATLTPSERLQEAAFQLNRELQNNPFFTPELAARLMTQSVDAYIDELERMSKAAEDTATQMTEFQRQAFSNMQDILADYLFDPFEDGLEGMLKSFADMLRQMIAQLVAKQILSYFFGLFGATATTGTTGNAIGIGRTDSRSRVVGENGPELFTPGASGSIRPIGAASFEMHTNIEGGGNLDIATLIPILEENNKKLKGEMLEAFDRGSYT